MTPKLPMHARKSMPLSVALDRLSEFDKRLLELRDSGMSYKSMEPTLGRSERMLASRASRLRRLPATLSEAEAAAKEAANQRSVGAIVPRTVAEMTEADRLLVRLYCDGLTLIEISERVGRNRRAVSLRLSQLRVALGENVVPLPDEASLDVARGNDVLSPGVIPCMCCKRPFDSWDRKRNRICHRCRAVQAGIDTSPEARSWA